jgi:hypothetical protein
MVNEKLVEYINSNLAKGHSLEEIREFVAGHGWSKEEFDEALMKASGSGEMAPPQKEQQPPGEAGAAGAAGAPAAPGAPDATAPVKKKGHKKLIVGVIILIILVLMLFYTIADIMSYFEGLYPAMLLPE